MLSVHDSERFCIRFGAFELEPNTGELRKAGTAIKLPPQAIGVLTLLTNAGGEIVRRDDIRQKIWGDAFVDFDHGLNRCIKQIRAALCDSAENPRYIETLRGRGYRFLIDAQKTPKSGPREQNSWPKKTRYALLGFKNLSQKAEQIWISPALSEMFITELASEGNVSTFLRRDNGESYQRAFASAKTTDCGRESIQCTDCDRTVDGSYVVVTRGIIDYIRLDVRVQDTASGTILLAFSESDALSNLPELVSKAGERLRTGLAPIQLRLKELAS